MKTILKSGLAAAAIAMLFSFPASNVSAGAGACLREYRACVAAGYPEIECENGYYYCLYGYIPVRSPSASIRTRHPN